LVDRAVELEYIGGTYGGSRKPAPFICLVLKMLQLQPELDIVYEFIKNKDYKYVTALGCFYLRLIGKPEDVYNYLEPLYNDYRKLRYRETDGKYKLIHMDEYIDELLLKDVISDTMLPRLQKRQNLEDSGVLKPRHSALEDLDEDDEALLAIKDEEENEKKNAPVGADELIENPRAAALKPDSEEKGEEGEETVDKEEERRRRKEKKRQKKEKKKKKYRTRGSISRSKSRERSDRSASGSRSGSRSRSRSRSERKKKKHSKWKKNLKEKRRDRSRERDRSKSRSKDRDEDRKRDKDDKKDKKGEGKVDENSEEYWLNLRAQLGLKPA